MFTINQHRSDGSDICTNAYQYFWVTASTFFNGKEQSQASFSIIKPILLPSCLKLGITWFCITYFSHHFSCPGHHDRKAVVGPSQWRPTVGSSRSFIWVAPSSTISKPEAEKTAFSPKSFQFISPTIRSVPSEPCCDLQRWNNWNSVRDEVY